MIQNCRITALCALVMSFFSFGFSCSQVPKGDPAKPALIWLGKARLPGSGPDMLFQPLLVSDDGNAVYGQYVNEKKEAEPPHYFKWSQDGSIKEITSAELPTGLVSHRPGSRYLDQKEYHDFVASKKFPALQEKHHLGGFRGISRDGRTILGDTGSNEGVQYPYLWRETMGMVQLTNYASSNLGITEKFNGFAYAISADGKSVAGQSDDPTGEGKIQTDMWLLYDPNGFAGSPTKVTGMVKSLSKEKMILLADLVTLPDGKTVVLKPAREKSVVIPQGVALPAGIKVGSHVVAVGADAGVGKSLTAAVITLSK